MNNKTLLKDEAELNRWQDSYSTCTVFVRDQCKSMIKPEQYPCVLVHDWHEDNQSRDWLNYEYVYLNDFPQQDRWQSLQ